MDFQELLAQAASARANAYAPYSGFAVGAALLCEDGTVVTGCNVENAAFSPGCCAERAAVFAAVSGGKRRFSAMAVVGGKLGAEAGGLCPPCGVCRQVLREFCRPLDFSVVLAPPGRLGGARVFTLAELLPESFGPENVL